MNPISPAGVSLLQTYSRQRSVRQRQDRPHLDELRLLLLLRLIMSYPNQKYSSALLPRVRRAFGGKEGAVLRGGAW